MVNKITHSCFSGLSAHLVLSVLVITGSATYSTQAQADDAWQFEPYLRVDLGYSNTTSEDAYAQDTAPGEVNILSNEGAAYQLGLGLKLNHFLRSDITVSYRDDIAETDNFHSIDNGSNFPAAKGSYETSNITTMLNVYFDPFAASGIDTGRFSSYLQAGIGWAHNRTKSANLNTISSRLSGGRNDDLAWQIGAGFNYSLTEHWIIDASYRYISMGEAAGSGYSTRYDDYKFDNGDPKFDLDAHEVMIGLQYQF